MVIQLGKQPILYFPTVLVNQLKQHSELQTLALFPSTCHYVEAGAHKTFLLDGCLVVEIMLHHRRRRCHFISVSLQSCSKMPEVRELSEALPEMSMDPITGVGVVASRNRAPTGYDVVRLATALEDGHSAHWRKSLVHWRKHRQTDKDVITQANDWWMTSTYLNIQTSLTSSIMTMTTILDVI